MPLAIAASFDLASVAFEPVLHSTGKAQLSLTARLIALAVLGVALALFIHTGPSGAAWAVTLEAAALYFTMGVMALYTLRRMRGDESLEPAVQSIAHDHPQGSSSASCESILDSALTARIMAA